MTPVTGLRMTRWEVEHFWTLRNLRRNTATVLWRHRVVL